MRQRFPLLVVAAALAATSAAATSQPTNVLLIISDDLRDTVGSYGNAQVHTPNLDAFARESVRFDKAYAQYPMCNPSRASFLSGLRPASTGVYDNVAVLRRLKPDVVTWPQYLREHGWYTACFGKVFHTAGATDAERAVYQDREKSWNETFFEPADTTPGPVVAGRNLTGGKLTWCRWAAVDCADEDMPDGQSAARAIHAMEQAGGKPWFIAVGFHRPHDPFVVPKQYFDLYPEGSLTLKRDAPDETPAPPLAIPSGAFRRAFARFTDRERMEFLRAYYAGVSFMDSQLGKVLAAVDRLGAREDTLVIFIGDNGYHLGERDWWNKNTLFERSCRVPLMVRVPGRAPAGPAAATVCPAVVELVDLFPTVIDFTRLPALPGLAGRSLRPQLEDPSAPGQGYATTVVGKQRGRTVRTARWRYTVWSDGNAELYDETRDPEETHNVAPVAANRKVIEELAALLPAR